MTRHHWMTIGGIYLGIGVLYWLGTTGASATSVVTWPLGLLGVKGAG